MTLAAGLAALGAGPAILVTVERAEGSTPREAGAAMLVSAGAAHGSIGGGQLEFHAVDTARAMLGRDAPNRILDLALGPLLGQCCGGRVRLRLERLGPEAAARLAAEDAAEVASRPEVVVFGAGHTGLALARALVPLPFRTRLVEDRLDHPAGPVPGVGLVRLDDPAAAVGAAGAGAAFVILTHSHALDYRLAAAALARGAAAYVGMIGSRTKRARFEAGASRAGVDPAPLVCPIGGKIADKRPAVIAALVAAELLVVFAGRAPAIPPGKRTRMAEVAAAGV